MSNNSANQVPVVEGPLTIAELLERVEPMGDLQQLAIDDLTPEEEDAYFAILEET